MPTWPQKVVKKGRQIKTEKDIKKAGPTTRLEFLKRADRVRNHNKGETPRGPGAPQFIGGRPPFGAPARFQKRSKNHYILLSNFETIFVALWRPTWLPKGPQNVTKSTNNQPKHKKKRTAPRVRTRLLVFYTPPGWEQEYYRNTYSCVGMAHSCVARFLTTKTRIVTARGLESNACCACLTCWKARVSYERGWKCWNDERHVRWEREFVLCICSMGIRFLNLWTPSMDYYNF